MQRDEQPGQTGISQPCDEAAADAARTRVVDQPAQQLDQHDLEQAVGQQSRAAAHAVGLGEQQVERGLQAIDLIQRDEHQSWQRRHQRVVLGTIEVEGGTREIRSVARRVVEGVRHRPGVEHQRRLVHDDAAFQAFDIAVRHHQLAPAQHMQEGAARLRVEGGRAAQGAGMEQVGPDAETIQQTGKSINGGGQGRCLRFERWMVF